MKTKIRELNIQEQENINGGILDNNDMYKCLLGTAIIAGGIGVIIGGIYGAKLGIKHAQEPTPINVLLSPYQVGIKRGSITVKYEYIKDGRSLWKRIFDPIEISEVRITPETTLPSLKQLTVITEEHRSGRGAGEVPGYGPKTLGSFGAFCCSVPAAATLAAVALIPYLLLWGTYAIGNKILGKDENDKGVDNKDFHKLMLGASILMGGIGTIGGAVVYTLDNILRPYQPKWKAAGEGTLISLLAGLGFAAVGVLTHLMSWGSYAIGNAILDKKNDKGENLGNVDFHKLLLGSTILMGGIGGSVAGSVIFYDNYSASGLTISQKAGRIAVASGVGAVVGATLGVVTNLLFWGTYSTGNGIL